MKRIVMGELEDKTNRKNAIKDNAENFFCGAVAPLTTARQAALFLSPCRLLTSEEWTAVPAPKKTL